MAPNLIQIKLAPWPFNQALHPRHREKTVDPIR